MGTVQKTLCACFPNDRADYSLLCRPTGRDLRVSLACAISRLEDPYTPFGRMVLYALAIASRKRTTKNDCWRRTKKLFGVVCVSGA